MTHHRRGLRRLLKDDDLLAAVEEDYRSAHLGPKRLSMLDYVGKLTATPGAIQRDDISALRDAGFSDTDILHIAEVAAYYAYVNRIASGLGVELES